MTDDDSDHDDTAPNESATSHRAPVPGLGLLRDPGVRAAIELSPLVLDARSEAHRFFWALLIRESGPNPFREPGRPMRAPRGRS